MNRIIKSIRKINYKLFISLLIMGLCPTIYTTIRVFFLGNLPGEWAFSIAGQLSWVNLLYEILRSKNQQELDLFSSSHIESKKY